MEKPRAKIYRRQLPDGSPSVFTGVDCASIEEAKDYRDLINNRDEIKQLLDDHDKLEKKRRHQRFNSRLAGTVIGILIGSVGTLMASDQSEAVSPSPESNPASIPSTEPTPETEPRPQPTPEAKPPTTPTPEPEPSIEPTPSAPASPEALDLVIGTYNILNGHSHAGKSKFVGGCHRNPVPGDSNCIETRTERQVKIVTGRANNPQFDIFGTQETSAEQYRLLNKSLDSYDSFPTNTSRMNNQQDGSVAIFWNTKKLTRFDSGKAPGVSNVVKGSLGPNGNVTVPWVGLRSSTGQEMYVMSVHYPISAYGGDRSTLLKASQLARDWVRSKASKDVPVFVLGDFNDRLPQDITYCAFTKNGLMQNVYDMTRDVNPSKHCPTNKDIGIDHIYATPIPGMSTSKWVRSKDSGIYARASDHTPVYVTAELKSQSN